jgi:hypothetical protein
MDSRPTAPGQFTVKADEEIAFFGPHGLVVPRKGKSAEVAGVPRNVRCGSIRYNGSRCEGACQALNSDLLTAQEINVSRLCRREGEGLKLNAAEPQDRSALPRCKNIKPWNRGTKRDR